MSKREKPFNNPFGSLKLAPTEKTKRPTRVVPSSPPRPSRDESETELFLQSIGEVAPLKSKKGTAPPKAPPTVESLRIVSDEAEAFTRLAELVAGTGPMDLADSDEYIEGFAQGLDVKVMQRLRKGDFSVQAHLDLHGMVRVEAKEALEKFIQDSRVRGLRCVLVVTGRGLHSKDSIPVLKEGVQGWLSRGRLARHVLAFTSARPHDGGVGAVYVLLRR